MNTITYAEAVVLLRVENLKQSRGWITVDIAVANLVDLVKENDRIWPASLA